MPRPRQPGHDAPPAAPTPANPTPPAHPVTPAEQAPADAAFAAAVGPVRPLRARPARASVQAPRRPVRIAYADHAVDHDPPVLRPGLSAHEVDAGTHVQWRRPGVQDRALRALRSPRFRPQMECDLHGLTSAQATPVLLALLADAAQAGAVYVRVVHGRGQAVLKRLCVELLSGHAQVLALCSAGPADGGSGALRVLLRRSPGAAQD